MSCGGAYPSVPRAAAAGATVEVSLLTGLVPLKLCQCLQSGVALGCFPTWQMLCGLGPLKTVSRSVNPQSPIHRLVKPSMSWNRPTAGQNPGELSLLTRTKVLSGLVKKEIAW